MLVIGINSVPSTPGKRPVYGEDVREAFCLLPRDGILQAVWLAQARRGRQKRKSHT